MARTISGSVGAGGVNKPADVRTVQELLNNVPPSSGGPTPKLVVDGLVGPLTIGAIRQFQKFHFGWNDGRVDTNNVTIAKLNEFDVPAPPVPGPPFRFREVRPDDGFDDSVSPPWQMVPSSGFKLVGLENAAGLTFVSLNPAIATVVQLSPSQIRVGGLGRGTAIIEARDASGTVVGRLEVGVKGLKTVRMAFNYVRDNASHATTRSVGDEVALLTVMNDIFGPQANVQFTRQSAQDVTIDQDLGPVVRFVPRRLRSVPRSEHEWDLVVAKADTSADFNIFFVWEYEQDASPNVDNTDAGTLNGSCIFEDKAGVEIGETLAHEAGHFLGVDDFDDAASQPLLMFGTTDDRGRKIPKAHADIMNP